MSPRRSRTFSKCTRVGTKAARKPPPPPFPPIPERESGLLPSVRRKLKGKIGLLNIKERQAEVAPAAIRHARRGPFVKSKQDTPVYLMHNTGEGAPGLMPPHLIPKDVIKHSLLPSALIPLPGRRRRRHSFRRRNRGKRSRFHRVIFHCGVWGRQIPRDWLSQGGGGELAARLSVTELLAERK